ncbi:MAG: metallophosphoesterase [Clostridiales bacterium]|jgi:predicted phosphodiesterase|nr:metallophosphoesterase [Clostridiales bacterium]
MSSNNKVSAEGVTPLRVIGSFFAVLAALLAVVAPIVNYGVRVGWVFIDHEIFIGFSELLFYVMIANGIYALGVAVATLAKKRIPVLVIIISVLLFILSLLFWLINYVSSDIAHIETIYISLIGSLPFVAALFGVPFLLLCFPNLKIRAKARNIIAVILSVIFVGTIAAAAFAKIPPIEFEFQTEPIVFDIGEDDLGVDKYSVVFATNADAQGYVTYSYNGEEKTVYANEAGVKAVGKIHAVQIPRDELDGNQYTVHATRVLDFLAYGGKLGKTIDGNTYTLKNTTNAVDPKIISASDWHQQLGLLDSASSYIRDDADLVLTMGDYADFYVNEQQVIDYFLKGAAIATQSVIPAIFVRGNHEVRGCEEMSDMGAKIGLKEMYYQVQRGNYMYTVLDTAEGEDGDQWEHDGFYDMVSYLSKQMDWFESLTPNPSLYNMVLMHDSEYTKPYDDAHTEIHNRFKAKANSFIDLAISGHSHGWDYTAANTSGFDFHRVHDGGTTGDTSGMSLSQVSFVSDFINENIEDAQLKSTLNKILGLVTIKKGSQKYVISYFEFNGASVSFNGVDSYGTYQTPAIFAKV